MLQFLIDGHRSRVDQKLQFWPEAIRGQLLTPLTRYHLHSELEYGVDNGCFSGFTKQKEQNFVRLIKRDYEHKHRCLFVCVPDVLHNHIETLHNWFEYSHLALGYKRAFVLQDGCDFYPADCDCVFVGGSNRFKDSQDAYDLCLAALRDNKHVHVGRINGFDRWHIYNQLGAHTCDGSGISRYDHMIVEFKRKYDIVYN